MAISSVTTSWQEVLEFWFPEGASLDIDPMRHLQHWMWRMQGGADGAIVERYAGLVEEAAAGRRDDWADNAHGRLALIIVLDQFPRSVWRNSPKAFENDRRALDLALEGYDNGHYDALETPWFKATYNLPLTHCEGPGHAARTERGIVLARAVQASAPENVRMGYAFTVEQAEDVHKVISAFGRHPHRNAVLGRDSTPREAQYLAAGRFPHMRKPGDRRIEVG